LIPKKKPTCCSPSGIQIYGCFIKKLFGSGSG
jgi:hypothetical protein